jgi:putative ABC transport system substrate-binding protein
MKRREFISLIGGAGASRVLWPLPLSAQQPALPVVGLLSGIDLDDPQFAAVRQGLNEAGYVAGKNVAIEHRSAAGRYDRLPALAAELVRRQVAVIVAIQGTMSALSAKAATATIPIVFASGSDPVKTGLVASLNRPGGNVTGVTFLVNLLAAKRLGLLRELVPGARVVGDLVNPTNPNSEAETKDMQVAARALGLELHLVNASSERDIDAAFASFAERRVDALIVTTDAYFRSRRDQIVALASRHALPTTYQSRAFTAAGGLMSYGTSITDAFRAAAAYAGKILKGAKPADLPVVQSTRFELVINLKTAKALGLTVPLTLQAAADEVIE